jgi:hypothetical protein
VIVILIANTSDGFEYMFLFNTNGNIQNFDQATLRGIEWNLVSLLLTKIWVHYGYSSLKKFDIPWLTYVRTEISNGIVLVNYTHSLEKRNLSFYSFYWGIGINYLRLRTNVHFYGIFPPRSFKTYHTIQPILFFIAYVPKIDACSYGSISVGTFPEIVNLNCSTHVCFFSNIGLTFGCYFRFFIKDEYGTETGYTNIGYSIGVGYFSSRNPVAKFY